MQLTQERDKILLCEDLVPLFLFVNLTQIVCESRSVTTLIGGHDLDRDWGAAENFLRSSPRGETL